MSHFSRIFSLVAIINTSSKQLCNQTTILMTFNSTVSDSLTMPANRRGIKRCFCLTSVYRVHRA